MDNYETTNNKKILRLLPSIDTLLRSKRSLKLMREAGSVRLAEFARHVIDSMRREMLKQLENGDAEKKQYSREMLIQEATERLEAVWQEELNKGLRRVINATGVIVHTNLGRAPLSERAKKSIVEEAARYCSLEYDVDTGERGKRGRRAERLLAELTGAEGALIVNNCAAAAVLVLTALCKGGEAIISRGELVEIGGDFRVPDVMKQSGAILVEVGTTNRTKVADYEAALTENTSLIVRVHPSNYRIVGFTAVPKVTELAELAHKHNALLYEDAGSGVLIDLSKYGLKNEPIINQSIASGADVVTFSGDKLLGGAQSGLIVGNIEVVERIRQHPLYRALRAGKLIYAALEGTLEEFRKGTAIREVPVLKMLSMTYEELRHRTEAFASRLSERLGEDSELSFKITDGKSVVGGGSAPAVQRKTTLLLIAHRKMSISQFEEKLRHSNPTVVTRVLEGRVVIDLRTVSEKEESELLEILVENSSKN